MKWLSAGVIWVALAAVGAAEPSKSADIGGVPVHLIEIVIELGYNLDPRVVDVIDDLRRAYPESPLPDLLEVGRLYWLQSDGDETESLQQAFEAEAERALERAKAYQRSRRDEVDAAFILAAIQLAQALYYADNGRWWSAYWTSRPALRTMRRIVERYPNYHDAKLPLGMANCYLADAPGYMKPLALLMRFDADVERGLQYMRAVRDGGQLFKVDARYHLGSIHIEVREDAEAAWSEYAALADRFPHNYRFNLMAARMERQLGRHEAARDRLLALLDRPQREGFVRQRVRAQLDAAAGALGTGQYGLALKLSRSSQELAEANDWLGRFGGWAEVQEGDALLGMGRDTEAADAYRRAASRDGPAREFATKRLEALAPVDR